jgi:hypothetical protein
MGWSQNETLVCLDKQGDIYDYHFSGRLLNKFHIVNFIHNISIQIHNNSYDL